MVRSHPDAGDAARIVRVTCPNPGCKTSLKTKVKNIGKRVLCPKCKTSVWVPLDSAPDRRPSQQRPLPSAPLVEDLYELDELDAPVRRPSTTSFWLILGVSVVAVVLFVAGITTFALWRVQANRELAAHTSTEAEQLASGGDASPKAKDDAPLARPKPDAEAGEKKPTLPTQELPRETMPSAPKETPPMPEAPPSPAAHNSPERKPPTESSQLKPKEETPSAPKPPLPKEDIASPALSLPPALPRLPDNLGWKKEVQEKLDKVLTNYPQDQVSAHLAFRDYFQLDANSFTASQRAWLEKAAQATQSHALAVVKHDFAIAEKSSDLHTMHLCLLVADRIRKDSFAEQRAAFATAQRQVIAGQRSVRPVWQITQVRGRLLRTFSDGTFYPITLTPKKGDTLLRVTARIENISTAPDLPYASTVLRFGDTNSRKDQITGPARIIQDDFLFVLLEDQGSRPCEYVCENCKALRGFTVFGNDSKTRQAIVIGGGTYVARGERFDLDVVFSMPKDTARPRLVVLGAAPIPIDVPGTAPQTRSSEPRTGDTGDRAKLQGTWKLVEVRWAEASSTSMIFITSKNYLTITGDELIDSYEGSDGKLKETKYKLELDASKTPPVYKKTVLEGPNQGKTSSGIYAITGDTLQMCSIKNGLPRDLNIVQGQDVKDKYLYIYQRQKP